MTRSFAAAPLTIDDIGVAFPLIRAALPDIDLSAWRSFARGLVDLPSPYPTGGVALRNEGGYLCGVLTYRIDRDLRHGTTLNVDVFAALDVTGEEAAMRALLQAAEEKARELRCAAVGIHIEGGGGPIADRFRTTGYRRQATIFCKMLEPRTALA
ncbi:MAG TPA: hypothetical protein VN668_22305 [Stellaceae bacterium]|nr:hypothetical protein [Stellaceae bacterium]